MASAASIALAGGAATLGLYWLKRKLEDAGEPPSVGRYPLVGSRFHLDEPLYLSMYQQFGEQPIVRVHFGTQCVYFFNRWSSFREAMVDNAEHTAGRPSQEIFMKLVGENGGIALSDGDVWRNYRRFALQTLRDLALGRNGIEEIITIEAEHMLSTLNDAAGQCPVETGLLMSTATSNVICQLVFGARLATEDDRFGQILKIFHAITQNSSSNTGQSIMMSLMPLVRHFPVLASLVLKLPTLKRMVANFENLRTYCNEQRERHAAEMGSVHQVRDFIDAHLQHQLKHPEIFTDTRLTLAVMDLFVAGTDTTANTLRWAILFLIMHPNIEEKMYSEIVRALGRDRLPKMQDRAELHYSQAVIEEVHRKACLAPIGMIHRVTQDITVCGVRLKANSLCGYNVYSIHHDQDVFPEPNRFLPNRHLNDGHFAPNPCLATFGLGKRACLGESLARAELFIFLTALVQRFRFSLDPEDHRTLWDLTEDPNFSKGTVMRAPPVHKIVFTPRT